LPPDGAKTTIYRRRRDELELALDAEMIDTLRRFANPVDVGDTRREPITFVRSVTKMLSARPYGPPMQGLVSEIATEPELGKADGSGRVSGLDEVSASGSRLRRTG
jgi:hypothetical protein